MLSSETHRDANKTLRDDPRLRWIRDKVESALLVEKQALFAACLQRDGALEKLLAYLDGSVAPGKSSKEALMFWLQTEKSTQKPLADLVVNELSLGSAQDNTSAIRMNQENTSTIEISQDSTATNDTGSAVETLKSTTVIQN